MGFMTEKIELEKGQEKQEQTAAIRAAVVEAITPLQREIASLRGEVVALKKSAEKPVEAVIDDESKIAKQIKACSKDAHEASLFSYVALAGVGVIVLIVLIGVWYLWGIPTKIAAINDGVWELTHVQ